MLHVLTTSQARFMKHVMRCIVELCASLWIMHVDFRALTSTIHINTVQGFQGSYSESVEFVIHISLAMLPDQREGIVSGVSSNVADQTRHLFIVTIM